MNIKEYEEIMSVAGEELKEWCDEKYEIEVRKYWAQVKAQRARFRKYMTKRHFTKKRYIRYGKKNYGFYKNTRGNYKWSNNPHIGKAANKFTQKLR